MPTKLSKRIFAMALTFMCPLFASASGAELGANWKGIVSELSESDVERIHHIVRNQMDGKPVGTRIAWDNPASGNSGTVQFILRYRSQGTECRKDWHILTLPYAPSQLWEVNVCKNGQSWDLSQPPKKL